MKINKELKKRSLIYLLLASILVIPIIDVEASTWRASNNASYPASFETSFGNYGGGQTFKITNGTTTYKEVYCSDPGVSTPTNANYEEVTLADDLQAGYNAICNAQASTRVKIDAVKGYAFLHDKSRNGGSAWSEAVLNYVYNGVTCTEGKNGCPADINNNTVKINTDLQAVKNLISTAEKGQYSAASVQLVGSVEGDFASYTLKANGIPGRLTIKSDYSGTLSINGEKVNDVKERSIIIDEMASDSTIKITFKISCKGIAGNTPKFSISYEYNEADSFSGYTAKAFHAKDAELQNLIACVPEGGATCDSNKNGECSIMEEGVFECTAQSCTPEVNVGSLSDGAAICDASGNTIVEIYEIPDENDILACVGDGSDELGNSIDVSSQLLDNDKYCGIYCYEDYSLILPGPDAAMDSDASVFINAGTYFTIERKLSSDNTVKCVTIKNIDAYKQDILDERTRIVDAYNKYSHAEAAAKTTCIEKSDPIYDSEGNITGYDEYLLVTTPSYKEMSMNGDSYKTTTIPRDTTRLPGTSCAGYGVTSSADELKNLHDVEKEAKENIDDYKEAWDSCDEWTFKNKMNSCEADITFEYYDGEEFGNPEITGKTISSSDSYEFLGGAQTTSVKDKVCTTAPDCNSANSSSEVIINGRTGKLIIESEYYFENKFMINAKNGDVYWANTPEATNCVNNNECYESEGFPVSINTTQGKYYYQYTFEGLGHYFDNGTCGRLDEFVEKYGSNDAGMKCYYDVNNCKDCDVTCSGDGCDLMIPDCNGDGCKVACVGGGCILDINSGFLATFRTISLNDEGFATVALLAASPNNLLAYNSTKNKFLQNESNWETDKGIHTARTISGAGENIYGNEPEYAIELTPKTINDIKGYNNGAGNYLNDTLNCKMSDKYGKCTSTFIDSFFDRSKYEAKFENYDDSKPGANEPFVGPAWK